MHDEDAIHPNKTLQEKLEYIYALRREGGRVNFDNNQNYQALLKAFGNPQAHLPPVVHLAGTNGKGSTLATIRSILEAAGYRVHAYTSPHLELFNERIYLAGKYIDDPTLNALLDETFEKNQNRPVTFFEFTTAMALAQFARVDADIVLLETGMGGRLDCTNVVDQPVLTVITQIAHDHMEFLGETLDQIAGEKAGILKQGVPCVIAPQLLEEYDGQIVDIFRDKADELGSRLCIAGEAYTCTGGGEGQMLYQFDGEEPLCLPTPNLQGDYQIDNAGTALAAISVLGDMFDVSLEHIKQGLQQIIWQGRLQRIEQGELYHALPEGWELWFDGGHNLAAASVLSTHIKGWKTDKNIPVHVLLHMKENKDIQGSSGMLAEVADALHIFANQVEFDHALSAITQDKQPARILLCGSLYNWAYLGF